MIFFESLSKMAVILFAIACGYLANKLGIMGGETDRKITKLILTFTLPAMTIGAVATSEELPDLTAMLGILKVAAVFYGLAFLAAAAAPYLLGGSPGQRGVWRFAACFANVGFIGLPVTTLFFGDDALIYAVIMMLPFNLVSYSVGPLMLTGGGGSFGWRQMLSPSVLSSALALVLTLVRLRPPALVGQCLELVGDLTVPLSLLIIGSILAGLSVGQAFLSPRLWGLAAIRLLALPVALFWILRGLNAETMVMQVAVVQMAMPVAANGTMLCMEYGGDQQTMAQGTFLTTLLAMVTVPLLVSALLL